MESQCLTADAQLKEGIEEQMSNCFTPCTAVSRSVKSNLVLLQFCFTVCSLIGSKTSASTLLIRSEVTCIIKFRVLQ